jgi:hypothetical protein
MLGSTFSVSEIHYMGGLQLVLSKAIILVPLNII